MAFIWQCKVYYATKNCELWCAVVKQHSMTIVIVFSGHNNSFLNIETPLVKVVTFNGTLLVVPLFNLDAAVFDIETESSLEIMKNAFHIILKALFALKVFKFFFQLFVYLEKRLDEKDKAKNVKMYIISIITISKCLTLQPIIAIHILPNISRNEAIQKSKFGQLTEYNIRNIFSWKIIYKIWWRSYYYTFLLYAKLRAIEI